jgi:hypothetical protein
VLPPVLTSSSAIAPTLRAVGGLTTAEIANAFLVPRWQEPAERPPAALHVLYLTFNEGCASSLPAPWSRSIMELRLPGYTALRKVSNCQGRSIPTLGLLVTIVSTRFAPICSKWLATMKAPSSTTALRPDDEHPRTQEARTRRSLHPCISTTPRCRQGAEEQFVTKGTQGSATLHWIARWITSHEVAIRGVNLRCRNHGQLGTITSGSVATNGMSEFFESERL